MPPQTLPDNFNGWDQKPPDTLPADFQQWDAPPRRANQPGAVRSFLQQFGVPTTPDEIKAALPHTMTDVGFDLLGNPVRTGLNLARSIDTRARAGATDIVDAVRNVRAGQPILPNLAKAGAGFNTVESGVAPGGAALMEGGQQIVEGNPSGAVGSIAAGTTQALLPQILEGAGSVGSRVAQSRVGQATQEAVKAGVKAGIPDWASKPVRAAVKAARESWQSSGPRTGPIPTETPTAVESSQVISEPQPVPSPEASGPITGHGEGIPRTLSGESALAQTLSAQPKANLFKIARSRGIDISRESSLNDELAVKGVIGKIVDNFSADELNEFRDTYLENTRMGFHQFGDIGKEAWQTMELQKYFPDVRLSGAALKRTAQAVSKNARQSNAFGPQTGGAPSMPSVDLINALEASLKAQAARK